MEAIVGGVTYVSQVAPKDHEGHDICGGCAGRHRALGGEDICGFLPACAGIIFVRKLDAISTTEPKLDTGPMVCSDLAPPVKTYEQGYHDGFAAGGAKWQTPVARSTDPSTSQKAAQSMARKAGKIADLILVELGAGNMTQGAYAPKLTGHELAKLTGVPLNSITPRFAQLSRKGLIHAYSGKGRETVWALGNGVQA